MSEVHPETCPDCGRPIPEGAPQGMCPKCLLSEAAVETVKTSTSSPAAPSFDDVAAAFPALELIEPIGEGGMGVVYKARQKRLDRVVALKLLRCPPESEDHFAERFLREARALAKLNHPNIVTVYDFGESSSHYYLLMEYVDGVNLRQAMKAQKLTPEEALRIVPIVCGALQYAHEKGVLHRDIKPANILLNQDGVVKMADFGLAKFVGEPNPSDLLTQTKAALGTPAYMAPEQTTDPSRVDHRADIYSLGVVFYEMLTGELPLGRFPAPSTRSHVDERVDDVVMRTLEREPDERYQSAKDVKTDVEHLSESIPGEASSVTPPPLQEEGSPAPPPSPPTSKPSDSSGSGAPSDQPDPKLSWRGVVGSLLVLFSLPGAALAGRLLFHVISSPGPNWPGAGISFLPFIILLFSLVLAGTGTLFGWSGAHQKKRHPEEYWGTFAISLAALTWPMLCLAGLLFTIAYYGRAHLDVVTLAVCSFPIALLVTGIRFRRWLLSLEPPKHWYWIFIFIIFVLPFYQVIREAVAQQFYSFPREARSQNTPTLESLLQSGAHIDQRGDRGETALMVAAHAEDTEKIRFLLERGAGVNAQSNDGETPLLIAAKTGNTGILKILIEHNADLQATLKENRATALHLAAHNNHAAAVDLLIDYGINADVRNGLGQTPLMLAAERGSSAVIHKLHNKAGYALLDLADNDGRTALDFAIAYGRPTDQKVLLTYGARKTASWWTLQAYMSKTLGWDNVMKKIQEAQAAFEEQPVADLRFGFDGWWYLLERPGLTLQAMLVEASARAENDAVAREALAACLRAWPEDTEILTLYHRRDNPTFPKTFQSLDLQKRDLDRPIRSADHDTSLSGTTRTNGPVSVGAGGLTSKTFFR